MSDSEGSHKRQNQAGKAKGYRSRDTRYKPTFYAGLKSSLLTGCTDELLRQRCFETNNSFAKKQIEFWIYIAFDVLRGSQNSQLSGEMDSAKQRKNPRCKRNQSTLNLWIRIINLHECRNHCPDTSEDKPHCR